VLETIFVEHANIISSGGFSQVFLGFEKEHCIPIAMKIFKQKSDRLPLEDTKSNYMKEMTAVSKYIHPNIIKCLGSGATKTHGYIAYQYAFGGDLFDFQSNNRPISELSIKRIFKNILLAVKVSIN
jgi:serine/threonine protein kinase